MSLVDDSMPLLDVIYDYLTAHVGHTTGWLIYKGYLPDEQDQCVGIFETGGLPADTMERENERLTFQLRVRGARLDYEIVRAKWREMFMALQDSLPGVTSILCQAEHYGPLVWNDPVGRVNMTTNWRIIQLNQDIQEHVYFKTMDDVQNMDNVTNMDTLEEA